MGAGGLLKTRALILALVAWSPFSPNAFCATSKPVICAYVFTRETPLAPGQVDGSKLTRINYAFANIEQGRIVEGAPATAGNLAVLTAIRHDNPNLTVLISVGGWLWSGRFSDMALTPASRATFIDSVATFLSRYDLDGLDIDWEFPGQVGAGNTFRPEDKQNYTSLVKELRARFDSIEKKTHRHLYLTVAVGATTDFLDHTAMGEVQKYVDTVNLMAYDYYEPGDNRGTGNHAPLFTDPGDPKAISADRSVTEYEKAGVPAASSSSECPSMGTSGARCLRPVTDSSSPDSPCRMSMPTTAILSPPCLGRDTRATGTTLLPCLIFTTPTSRSSSPMRIRNRSR